MTAFPALQTFIAYFVGIELQPEQSSNIRRQSLWTLRLGPIKMNVSCIHNLPAKSGQGQGILRVVACHPAKA